MFPVVVVLFYRRKLLSPSIVANIYHVRVFQAFHCLSRLLVSCLVLCLVFCFAFQLPLLIQLIRDVY
jgi:hypothetical protein